MTTQINLNYVNQSKINYYLSSKEQALLKVIQKDISPIKISFLNGKKTFVNNCLTIPGVLNLDTNAEYIGLDYILHEIAHAIEAEKEKLYYPVGYNFYEGKVITPSWNKHNNGKAIRRETRVVAIANTLAKYYKISSTLLSDIESLVASRNLSSSINHIPISQNSCEDSKSLQDYRFSFLLQCANNFSRRCHIGVILKRLEIIKEELSAKLNHESKKEHGAN